MDTALAKKPNGSEAAIIPATPMSLVEMLLSKGAGLEQIERYMDLQKRWQESEARNAFVQAMANFKAENIVIVKDKVNKQYNSRYTSLGNLVTTVTPYLSKHGLSARWELDQASGIKVTCIIQHSLGHKETVSITVPPDTSGAKNLIQQIKSAITYAKACTFESICGLASTDANVDDDGNGAFGDANETRISEEIFVQRRDAIAGANNQAELKKIYMAACEEAGDDLDTKKAYGAAKNKRYRELANVNG